ncbi:MAG: excisionase [Pseudomonadota bacterium]
MRTSTHIATAGKVAPLNTAVAAEVRGEWMLIKLFSVRTGYTEKAVRRKIEDGLWVEGIHYRRAPDGHITMNLLEYYRWVEGKASS